MTGEPHVRIDMISQPRYLAAARALIAAMAQRAGFTEHTCGQIALALDEALCNVMRHGYERRDDGRIWISIWPLESPQHGLCILIEDEGRQVDPNTICSRDLDDIRPGGLGVHIMQHIMDRVEYRKRDGCGMSLLMEKCCNDSESRDSQFGLRNCGSNEHHESPNSAPAKTGPGPATLRNDTNATEP